MQKSTTTTRGGSGGTTTANNGEPNSAKKVSLTQKVLVTAGKPSEFTFKLSRSEVAPGKVAFHVTKGVLGVGVQPPATAQE